MWRRVWISERRLKKGKSYCLRWLDRRGRVRTESVGRDRKLAEALGAQREVALNAGALRKIRRVRFEQFRKEEEDVMKGRVADGTVDQIRISLDHFARICEPAIVADTDVGMVEQFYSQRLKEVAEATANKDLRHLKASFNRAVRRGYMAENPARWVRPVREPERQLRILSPDEVGRLLEACPSAWWRALVAVAVTTGMRRGELLALRWEDVDLESATIWVRNTPGHRTKSRRNRALALGPEVAALLRPLPHLGTLVFGRQGGPLRGDTVSKAFAGIVKESGISRCTLHDLRRTFVSHLANAGVNAALVQKLAGHSAIATTVKYYTGFMPEALRAAQARLPFGAVIGGVSNSSPAADEAPMSRESSKIIKLSLARG